MDVGCYPVNFARMIAGNAPDRVAAAAHWAPSEVDETLVASLEYPGDLIAQISCSLSASRIHSVRLIGSAGRDRAGRGVYAAARPADADPPAAWRAGCRGRGDHNRASQPLSPGGRGIQPAGRGRPYCPGAARDAAGRNARQYRHDRGAAPGRAWDAQRRWIYGRAHLLGLRWRGPASGSDRRPRAVRSASSPRRSRRAKPSARSASSTTSTTRPRRPPARSAGISISGSTRSGSPASSKDTGQNSRSE